MAEVEKATTAIIALPADLPENWTLNQIVSPNGTEVNLTRQHGYNYLMQQVNASQRAANQLGSSVQAVESEIDALQIYAGKRPAPRVLTGTIAANTWVAAQVFNWQVDIATNTSEDSTKQIITLNFTTLASLKAWIEAGGVAMENGTSVRLYCNKKPAIDLGYQIMIEGSGL